MYQCWTLMKVTQTNPGGDDGQITINSLTNSGGTDPDCPTWTGDWWRQEGSSTTEQAVGTTDSGYNWTAYAYAGDSYQPIYMNLERGTERCSLTVSSTSGCCFDVGDCTDVGTTTPAQTAGATAGSIIGAIIFTVIVVMCCRCKYKNESDEYNNLE